MHENFNSIWYLTNKSNFFLAVNGTIRLYLKMGGQPPKHIFDLEHFFPDVEFVDFHKCFKQLHLHRYLIFKCAESFCVELLNKLVI